MSRELAPDLPAFHAVIVAAGRGERAGLPQPKQFARLVDKSVLRWSVEAFARHPGCATIVVVTAPEADSRTQVAAALANLSVTLVDGGETRQQSVANGLAVCAAERANLVLVHDAARPGVDGAVIDRLLLAFDDAAVAGAVPLLPVVDTLVRANASLGETVDRDGLWHVQTPQAFRLDALRGAHARQAGLGATDDAQLVRADGGRVAAVTGNRRLAKITHPGDLEHLTALLCGAYPRAVRVGSGFDVHRLVPGDGVWLCGVRIVHDRKLDGHSDADVALHALTDAVLGGIGAGDIGGHFPPSDPRWRGAASDQFLRHAVDLAAQAGLAISHLDCTIICEAPKIGPHRDAMRARVAAIAGLMPDQVSIKATTTERLGFTGRSEGIAAQAVATLWQDGDGR